MKLVDNRAFLGALALNITGLILAFMVYQYMNSPNTMQVFTRSRLVWEIIMNLQVLSFALMWVCYSDRIEAATGSMRTLQHVRRWFSVATILLPTGLGLIGIQQNWFLDRPSDNTLIVIAVVVFGYWIGGVLLNRVLTRRIKKSKRYFSLRLRVLAIVPITVLVLLALASSSTGNQVWLCLIPVLVYLQGSVPYLFKAFGAGATR